MIIVRPRSILSTPKELARALKAKTRYFPNPKRPNRIYDYKKDFFYTLPAPQNVRNAPLGYLSAATFFSLNKYHQRMVMKRDGLNIPETFDEKEVAEGVNPGLFVVRRYHHQKGQFYKVTKNPLDFILGREYVSRVFPKTREYRLIYVFGQPLIQLRKKPHEGAKPEEAWNFEKGSFFQTVNDVESGVLKKYTDVYQKLEDFPPVKHSHICAVDILFNSTERPNYVICEINSAPSLKIERNLEKVVTAIKERW